MTHYKDNPKQSGIPLLTVANKVVKPQDGFPFRRMVGVDKDGETVRIFDLESEYKGKYFVIFFFPMDFSVDSSEVMAFAEASNQFAENSCEIIGVTADNPLAIKRWVRKNVSQGGFGTPPGFPILTDKNLALSMSLCVAKNNGVPARATFIVDWAGLLRYSMVHRSNIGRSVKETVRMVLAFRHSDMTGEALPSGWTPGGETIPTDFSKKVAYFLNKFGHKENAKENNEIVNNIENSEAEKEEKTVNNLDAPVKDVATEKLDTPETDTNDEQKATTEDNKSAKSKDEDEDNKSTKSKPEDNKSSKSVKSKASRVPIMVSKDE